MASLSDEGAGKEGEGGGWVGCGWVAVQISVIIGLICLFRGNGSGDMVGFNGLLFKGQNEFMRSLFLPKYHRALIE